MRQGSLRGVEASEEWAAIETSGVGSTSGGVGSRAPTMPRGTPLPLGLPGDCNFIVFSWPFVVGGGIDEGLAQRPVLVVIVKNDSYGLCR
jgi:hypothetical protein